MYNYIYAKASFWGDNMSKNFAETLCELRSKSGLTQQQLADKLFVDRSTISHWKSGRRVPDSAMLNNLAHQLGVDASMLFTAVAESSELNVIIVDDEKIILTGSTAIISSMLPTARIAGFTKSSEALEFVRNNRVSLAFVDIEIGRTSGIDLCRELIKTNPMINVVFLTSYPEYALKAWNTGACGFLVKPLTIDAVKQQLAHLRHPIPVFTQPDTLQTYIL